MDAEDVRYGRAEGVELLATVYRPEGGSRRAAVVDVHGGAWRWFDRRVDDGIARALAAAGHVVVALDVRLAPDHRWPTAAADVNAGVRWVRAHAIELGVDPDRIGLLGSSSGGQLALATALRPGDPTFATTEVVPVGVAGRAPAVDGGLPVDRGLGVDAGVAFVVALYPVAMPGERWRYLQERLARGDGARTDPGFDAARLARAQGQFFADEAAMHDADVVTWLEAGAVEAVPPALVAHGDLDENVTTAMTARLVAAYRRAGGSCELRTWPDVGHGFVHAPSTATDECLAAVARFVATAPPRR